MRHGRHWLAFSLVALLGWGVWSTAQPPKRPAPPPVEEPAEEPSAEDAREAAIAERFRKVLESNPRRGTALDRLYGYHVERGTIDQLIKTYTDRTAKDPKDGVAWMIVGLVESQRGRDAAAVAAFRKAEESLPDNAIPGYYLGQSLVLVGQPDAAAEAFERAIARKPNRNDLLDTFQALGRVYQRAQRTEKALAVWDRLEKLYPDDARVQEQIATTLTEEGQLAQALPRVEKLAAQTDDKYRQAALKMDAADLKVRLKRTPDALADFEKLLADLNPESWLYRDVRRRIEDVFLRNDDLAGLAKYYETWLAKNPTDVDAIARLAKTLTSQGRTPDARSWLEKGTAAAPTNRALRQALIDQYVFVQDYPAAAGQYEAMDKADPNNPDTLREWGKLLLKDPAKPETDRKAAAAAVWKRMLAKKPNDPVTASQVADLMRTGGVTDEAVALYKKAIELAPAAAQYREYLGEYFHSQGKSAEALAMWRPIAEGANRTARNLVRLAEVMAGFGYRTEALAAMADAINLEKDDFTMLMTYADLLNQDNQYDAALAQIDAAAKLTSNPEEVEQVLTAQIKVYQETEKLGDKIDELQKDLDAGKDPTAERWLRLARYYEANRQADKATVAVVKAGERDPKSVPVLIAAARVNEAAGNLLAAADTNRKLAALDRRFRSEYLQAVAKLEQRLGRKDQALQAGRDVLAASPGNPEVYKFFADLCFQLGDQEEGLEALRRSVRANPSDPAGLLTLANALAERVRQGEAIELLWRAFEKTNELDGRLSVIDRITQLYLENNQFDRLMERLERERREAEKAREMTLCIAQAYATAGDLGTARQQLERLLTENVRDTHLLGQLATLCEQEGDLAAAVKFQRQLTAAAPNSYDHQLKLAQLLTKSGEPDEAADIWVKLVAGETEPHRNLSAIDQLLSANKPDAALAILARMLAQKPGNWELMYREGAALAGKQKTAEAAARFRAILALRHQDDELGAITKHRLDEAKRKAKNPDKTKPAPGTTAAKPTAPALGQLSSFASLIDESATPPLSRRKGSVYRIRQAVGAENEYYGNNPQAVYTPSDYGEARMACLGWLNEFARATDGGADAFAKELRGAKDKPEADHRALWDWYYFQLLKSETKDLLATALALSKTGDPAGLLAYLSSLGDGRQSATRSDRSGTGKDATPPLPADQLTHALACYRKLQQVKPTWATAPVTRSVMAELKRAKRDDDEKAIYKELVDGADTVAKVQTALGVAASRTEKETCYALYAKLEKLQPPPKKASTLGQLPTRAAWSSLQTLMGKLSDAKNFAEARAVLDLYLFTARRQNLAAPRAASVSKRARTGSTGVTLYSKTPSGRTQTQITYPSPNDYYDSGSITILYNAFNLHKQADVLSDLFAHVRKQLDAAPPGAERLYLRLALGYLHWWNNEKDEALTQLTAAVKDAPDDHGLLLEVADLREKNGEPDAALALLDSITPPDTQTMQAREEAALRSAEKTGNLDRARQAAERLFGLRLDADKQLELAGKMYRLGLHEMAETVLGRAQRQAGNKSATLVRLMTQYQSQGQTDLAVQIARQVLRKGPSAPTGNRGGTETDSARQQAIGVLARSGQIKEMIERAEAQLKASPKSVQIYQSLVGYYQAAGDKSKFKAALLKMGELKPDDGKLRYSVAEQLRQAGENDAALGEYKAALKLEPSLYSNNYWQIQQLFSQQGKFEDLAKLMDDLDFRKMRGQYYEVAQIVSELLANAKTKDLGLRLFKKGWEAFPRERGYYLGYMSDDAVWRLPEIYDYAKQAVIPREDSAADPWQSVGEIMSYGQEGRVDGVFTRMMSIARKQQRLPELRAEVAAALAKKPDWVGGKAMLAVIDVQSGRKDEGKKLWQEVFDDPKADVPPLSRFILTQELEFYAGTDDLAVKTLEGGIDDLVKDGNYQFSYSPARRLIWWYDLLGRQADARKVLARLSKIEMVDPGYSGGYWQRQLVENGLAFAQAMQKAGDPVEAVRVYQKLLADKEQLVLANQYGNGNYTQQIEQGMKTALKATKPDLLAAAVGTLLTPQALTPANRSVLDPVLLVESRDLTKATLTGMFATVLKKTDKTPAVRREAITKLAELAKAHPADLSVRTAAALAALADGNPDAAREAVEQLAKLVESTPLDALPDGKANARQRAEALQQVQVWLVAKECFGPGRDKLQETGAKLAERAIAAAKRQQDLLFAVAILREWGQIELDRGDKAKAEARWAEMLDLLVPKPPAKKPATPAVMRPAEPGMVYVQAVIQPAPARPAPAAPVTPRRGNVPVLTADQFEQAYQIAMLTAEKKLTALSLRAMTDAVRGGPPVQDTTKNRNGGGSYRQVTYNGVQYLITDGGKKTVSFDQALVRLVSKWREIGVPPADVYEVLAAAVLPAARPAEVFAFGEAKTPAGTVYKMSGGSWTPTDDPIEEGTTDRGLSGVLCDLAVEAGKADDLRTRAEARANQPLGEVPARVLLATLAVAAKDDARAAEALKALADRAGKTTAATALDPVAAAAHAALARPALEAEAAALLQKVAMQLALGNNLPRAQQVGEQLVDHYLSTQNYAKAKALTDTATTVAQRFSPGNAAVPLMAAEKYLRAGYVEDALKQLGAYADASTVGAAGVANKDKLPEPVLAGFPRLVRLLLDMPADKRYGALKAWSLPAEGRKSVRYFVGTTPKEFPPPQFVKLPAMPADRVVSTMVLLADAAKECGKADELLAAADKLAADKVENAELFAVLVKLALGKGKESEPAVKAFAEAAKKRMTPPKAADEPVRSRYYNGENQGPAPARPSEFLFASLCLADPALAGYGADLLKPMIVAATNGQNHDLQHRVQAGQDRLTAAKAGAADAAAGGLPAGWHPAGPRDVWFAQDGYLTHGADSLASYLLFDAPLAGTFEFAVDAHNAGGTGTGPAGYAGVMCQASQGGSGVFAVGGADMIQRPTTAGRYGEFNRLTFQVSPTKVRCLVNGQLFYEDIDPAPTSPWLALHATPGSRPVFRNPVLSGKPEVPNEVKLTAGDYLDGWGPYLSTGSMPKRLSAKEPKPVPQYDEDNGQEPPAEDDPATKKYDWQAKAGEVLGRKFDRPGAKPAPAVLAYFRPLRAGETVRYEFFHEPGKTHVDPTLGRLAFRLDPDGVRLHYLTDAGDDWTGLAADNTADDPAGRKAKPALKAGDWNAVALTTTADGVKVELNGTVVYEAALPAGAERKFGLFHYRDKTAARVRNVVLTGNWPKAVDPAAVAFATKPATPAEGRARRKLIGDQHYAAEAGDVIDRAKKLPTAGRVEALVGWVLPTDARPAFQLAGVVRADDTPVSPGGKRVVPVTRFAAPCLELVAAAKELQALDALAISITKADAPGADDLFRRAKAALLAVIRSAQGKDAEAAEALKQLRADTEKLPLDADGAERWPAFVAAVGCLDRPGLVTPAGELLAALAGHLEKATEQEKTFSDMYWWQQAVPMARGRAAVAAQPDGVRRPFGSDPGLAHWAPASGLESSGPGPGGSWSPAHWTVQGGTVTHFPGHADDALMLRTPLRGDFEVTCELGVKEGRQAHVRYGGYKFELLPDRKKMGVASTLRDARRETTIAPPLPESKAESYQFKLAVKDGWVRAFVDGRELSAERLGPAPEPWLAIHCAGPATGEVKNLRVAGTPTVPAAVDPLAGDDLPLWQPLHGNIGQASEGRYRNVNSGSGTWMKRGEELFAHGKRPEPPEEGKPTPPRGYPESAIFYQRPLLEDGTVEYEFFYDPDKALVHPALGRLVFLLDPDGVKLHRLTDGAAEAGKLAADNAADEPDARKGPTKLPLTPKAWNRVRLAVVGDRVKVAVNGEEVYDRAIDPANQRQFGLFHYTDRTEARVRTMTLTGDWPKQVPQDIFEKMN